MKQNRNNRKYSKKGFSLIEVLISVSLFVMIILSATEIFMLVINGQRSAVSSQNLQESLKYFFEVTGKEMRMAIKNDGSCPGVVGKVFNVTSNSYGDILTFQNFYKECVSYKIASDGGITRFEISRNSNTGFISPKKIEINNLRFVLNESGIKQPTVTILIKGKTLASSKFPSELEVQTTITSRYYK